MMVLLIPNFFYKEMHLMSVENSGLLRKTSISWLKIESLPVIIALFSRVTARWRVCFDGAMVSADVRTFATGPFLVFDGSCSSGFVRLS